MQDPSSPLATQRQFFDSLISSDRPSLDQLLADDFVLIDVMGGPEITKPDLLKTLGSGELKFEAIEPADTRVRIYGHAAVITGRMRIGGRVEQMPFVVRSRYTYLFVQQQERWRLVSA